LRFASTSTARDVNREISRLDSHATTAAELRRLGRERLERIRQLKFEVAAWLLGMAVLTRSTG
jgi:hypothetical protein